MSLDPIRLLARALKRPGRHRGTGWDRSRPFPYEARHKAPEPEEKK